MAGVIVTTRQEDFDKITEEKWHPSPKKWNNSEEAEKIPGRYFDEKAKDREHEEMKELQQTQKQDE